nr:MAG TPA: hypothetical protein [Caudoviricetes sp.]
MQKNSNSYHIVLQTITKLILKGEGISKHKLSS